MLENEDLLIYYGQIQTAYEALQNMPGKFRQKFNGDRTILYQCNTEEIKISELLNESIYSIAKVLDAINDQIYNTEVYDINAKCEEDAHYLAKCNSERDHGIVLKTLCIEQLPTEYESSVLWRIIMRLPEEKDDDE